MNDETKAMLGAYLKKMLEAIEHGATFAGEQIPLVIQEKLHFELVMNILWGAFFFLIYVGLMIPIVRWWKKDVPAYSDEIEARIGITAVSQLLLIPTFINVTKALKITLAPRLYILEWLRRML